MSLALPTVDCGSRPSARLLRALAPFGLLAARVATPLPTQPSAAGVARVLSCPGGSVVLILGPSGCGKSTLLHAVADTARGSGTPVIDAAALLRAVPSDRPIIDLLDGPMLDALRLFAAAGLAEPMLWARAAAELSEGQRLRLGLALAMAQVPRAMRSVVLLDECCSTLDRVTAHGVARTLRRWATGHPRVLVVCATAHDDLTTPLRPDLVVEPPFEGGRHADSE